MDNQHRKIKGYRELSEAEIAAMNEVKEIGVKLGELVERLRFTDQGRDRGYLIPDRTDIDQVWVTIGATHLQQGLMALTRAIAKPEFF